MSEKFSLTVRFEPEDGETLRRIAARHGMLPGTVVRQMVEDWIAREREGTSGRWTPAENLARRAREARLAGENAVPTAAPATEEPGEPGLRGGERVR